MKTFEEVMTSALNGCCHEFHVCDLMTVGRDSVLACQACGAEATAGEVAWMLAGGRIVKTYCEIQASEQAQQIVDLVEAPVVGGFN